MQFRSIGKDVTIYPLARIICPEEISIGNNVIIDDFVFLYGKGGITIGDFVHISHFSSVSGGSGLVIGDFATISSGVRICTGNDDYSGMGMTNPTIPKRYRSVTRGSIHIGKHVIIGANSVILPNVEIGEGVAIGACSLVKGNCYPWKIYAGCPVGVIAIRESSNILKMEKKLRDESFIDTTPSR